MPDPRALRTLNNQQRLDCMRDVRMWWDVVARAGSSSADEGDVRKPKVAARPSAVRREGERQASRARGDDVRKWKA